MLVLYAALPAVDAMDFEVVDICKIFDDERSAFAFVGANLKYSSRIYFLENLAPCCLVAIKPIIGK